MVSQRPTERGGDGDNRSSGTVRLTIPARPEYITLCRLALTGIARLRSMSDEVRAIADDVEIGSKPGGTGSRLRFAKALT